jgi:hemoglobin
MAIMRIQHEMITNDSVQKMVDTFYNSLRQNSILGPVFERALPSSWDAHIALITEFWSIILLGSHSFQGNILAKHMAFEKNIF